MTKDQMLQALLREIVAIANKTDDCLTLADSDHADMLAVGIPYHPDHWHGKPLTSAQRMACSRAVRALAAAGLVERVTETQRDRTTHLRPTAAGLSRAIRLATNLDRTDVLAGLRRTAWGAALADQLTPTRASNSDALQPGSLAPGIALPDNVAHGSPSLI